MMRNLAVVTGLLIGTSLHCLFAAELPTEASQEIARYQTIESDAKKALVRALEAIQDKVTKQGRLEEAIAVKDRLDALRSEETGNIVDVIVTKDPGSLDGYELVGKWGAVNGGGDDVFLWIRRSKTDQALTDVAVFGRSGAPIGYKSCGFVWDCSTATDAWGTGSEWPCGIVSSTEHKADPVKDIKLSTKPIMEGYEARGNFNGLTFWVKRS